MSADSDSDYRDCASCGDLVLSLSSRHWCDACEATSYELAFPEVNAVPGGVDSRAGAVEIFTYKHTQIRAVEIGGQRWAVAADICAFLEIKDVPASLRRIDDDDRLTIRRSDTRVSNPSIWDSFAPQVQAVNLVSEDGSTDLVLDSRKPDARRFRRFLTHTVWASVRDTGSYSVEQVDLSDPLAAIKAANTRSQQAVEIAESERAARIAAERQSQALSAAIERDAPLVAKAEAHSGSDSAIHRQEFAREVQLWARKQGIDGIKHSDVMRFLGHIGLFIRGDRTDTGHATSEAQRRGLAYTHKDTAKNGHAYAVGRLTASGQNYAWNRITKHIGENGDLRLPRELRGGDPA
jgi:prophage antirepressor-like protein